ncbi:MAG: ABC transporter permease [Bacteroidaceae bacterium]|nr:ABC transporter permease [Bacteroidaceae bacterium]
MNLPVYLAKRIYNGPALSRQVSRPAVIISMIGIAIGLAVMIIAVSVITGFKSEIRSKVTGFAGHLLVTDVNALAGYESCPIVYNDSLLQVLAAHPQVEHVQRYSQKAGMVKTASSFQGVMVKGVGPDYNAEFLRHHLTAGEFPAFSDTVSSNGVVISQTIADKLQLQLGDKIDTYFFDESMRARKLLVVGIYETHFAAFDGLYVFTDMYMVNRLNHWETDEATGVEVTIKNESALESITYEVGALLNDYTDRYGTHYCAVNVEQLQPAVFSWLEVLDVNIWVILVLMIGIAGFTMIAGLLIIIIERTQMIGVLKSMGANNTTVRHLFLWLSVFLIGRGMLWGNVIGLAFYFLQQYTGIFTLDPTTYYMDTVPVSLSFPVWLLLNIGTLAISVLMLVGPSYIVARIHPANSMRYE